MTQEQLDALTELKRSFQLAFTSPAGVSVLKELGGYCRAHSTTAHENAHLFHVLEGRRQVYLRIQQYLNLSVEQLFDIYFTKGNYDA